MFDIKGVQGILQNWQSALPENYQFLVPLAGYVILIALYGIFIWKFYRFLAKRDIIELNLWKYSRLEHAGLRKFFATILYLVEYIIIMPFIIFFWFVFLCLFLMLIAKELAIERILLIGIAIVAAIRITAYFNEDLSRDLAKMFPFTILAVFLVTPGFFSLSALFARAIEIPLFFKEILFYILFVVGLEFVMRIFSTIRRLIVSEEIDAELEEEVEAATSATPNPTK